MACTLPTDGAPETDRKILVLVQYLLRCSGDSNEDLDTADNTGNTPLMKAVANNDLEIVRFLVDSKADLSLRNKMGHTALYIAQARDYTQIYEYLLDKIKARDLMAKLIKI